MAYARFDENESDVYIYGDSSALECVACRLQPRGSWNESFRTTNRMVLLDHVIAHLREGHRVPESVALRLVREIASVGYDY